MGIYLNCALCLAFLIGTVTFSDCLRMARTPGSNMVRAATYEDVKAVADDDSVYLIDVREPLELQESGVIPGSINIPLMDLKDVLENMSREEFLKKFHREKPEFDTPIIFTCRSGRRSLEALKIAEALGFQNLRNFAGGWLLWEEKLEQKYK